MVNTSVIAQAAPGIRGKLQKLKDFAGINIMQLIKLANKVYLNREVQAERKMKKKASFLEAALKEREMTKRQRKSSYQEAGSLGHPYPGTSVLTVRRRGMGRTNASTEAKPQSSVATGRSLTGKGSLAWQEQTQIDKNGV